MLVQSPVAIRKKSNGPRAARGSRSPSNCEAGNAVKALMIRYPQAGRMPDSPRLM